MPKLSFYDPLAAMVDADTLYAVHDGKSYQCTYAVLKASILGDLKLTILSVTQQIAADTNFSVTSSGTGYTHSGAEGMLLESAELFNAAGWVKVYVNGIMQEKGSGAVWVNDTTLKLDAIVDNGDTIIILS